MDIMNMQQGSPQWAAHRATHFNASDCAAMLGVCPYKTRDQLLHEKKTGIQIEVNGYKKALFERGHQFEKWAREREEKQVGEELFPCVGVLKNSRLSASFDGLTLDRSLVWEHKMLSHTLRNIMQSADALPLHYRLQLEQQLLISGASKAVFMASNWSENGELIEQYKQDYFSDAELRQYIISGWRQFEQDLANYVPSEKPDKQVNERLPALPSLHFHASGDLYFSGNLDRFKQRADSILDTINVNLLSEDDFSQAEIVIKWCKSGEDQLNKTQSQLIDSTPNLKALFSTITTLQNRLRDIRLDLDKQVKTEKARIKHALIDSAVKQVHDHYQDAGITYLERDLLLQKMELAIKGLKHLDKIQNALDRVIIEEKTTLNQQLERGELTRLISLEEINTALAPLSISDEGLKQMGFNLSYQPIRASEFLLLIQQLITHLAQATLPKALAKTA